MNAVNSGKESSLSDAQQQILTAARALIAAVDTSDPVKTALAIEQALAAKVTYVNDDSSSTDDTAYGALIYGQANCDGYADAFYLCGSLAGLTVRYQHGAALHPSANDSSDATHLWNLVQAKGAWTMVDVTWDDNDDWDYFDTIYFMIGQDRASIVYLWDPDFSMKLADKTDLKRCSVPEYECSTADDITAAVRDAVNSKASAFYLVDTANGRLITGKDSFQQALTSAGVSSYGYGLFIDLPFWRIYDLK